MDETLVLCAVDLSGRPYLVFDGEFTTERLGTLDTEMIREFFYAVSYSAGMNLHIKVLSPEIIIIWQKRCLRHLPELWMKRFPMIRE